ncbi:hypothetical protein HELRODRAFT_163385 [Helobdella robusta]|uniref:Uncharacterized protein n=1 Tax=Helobdella robusta TaxID=6412 RepID=T1ETZ5_HELRO|nr:hypothetical protein HELRODRAFT_163385 [Helobdella robusta]ESN96332.1 hypothetical protein HELRODRAFT_163385 [Helobdella robusta]
MFYLIALHQQPCDANGDGNNTCIIDYLGQPEAVKSLNNCSICPRVTCWNVLFSSPTENNSYYKDVKSFMKEHESLLLKPTSEEHLLDALKENGCGNFMAWRQYDTSPPTRLELEEDIIHSAADEDYNEDDDDDDDYIYIKDGKGAGTDDEKDDINKVNNSYTNQHTNEYYNVSEVIRLKKPYSIAYNILTHENFQQLESLLSSLYRPHNQYCIHVDAKSKDMIAKVQQLIKCFDNVFLASKMETVVYAGISRLRADLNCMKDHVTRKKRWRYLLNMAASGYPLKTNEEIVKYLKNQNGSNLFVTIKTEGNEYLRRRFLYKYYEINGELKNSKKPHSPPPHNLTIVKGSAYGAFTRAFVHFLLTDQRAIDYLNWCNLTYSPDEHYWQTLHHTFSNPGISAPGGSTKKHELARSDTTEVSWYPKKCFGHYVRGVCVYGVQDLPFLLTSQRLLLNKFRNTFEPLAILCMEKYLKSSRICPLRCQQ